MSYQRIRMGGHPNFCCTMNILWPLHNIIITYFVPISKSIKICFALAPQSIKIQLLFIPSAVMQSEHTVSVSLFAMTAKCKFGVSEF